MIFFPTVDEDFQYFRSQGYTGSLNDMHYKAMGDLGYTGALNDRIHAFLTFKYGSFYEAMRDLRNGTSVFSLLSSYSVNGLDPALVFDFVGNYFRKDSTESTITEALVHNSATAGNATMTDSDGLLKWRPHNNLTKSNTFSTWNRNSTVVVDNAAVGPNGVANTASVVTFSTGNSYLYNLAAFTVSVGNKVTLAAWVRSDTITSITFAINGRTNSANNTLETNLAVTSTWALVSFEATVLGNDTGLFFMIGKYNASSPVSQIGELELYGAHLYRSDLGGMVNNPETGDSYVPTTSTERYLPRVGHHIYNGSAWVNEGILHESEARTNLLTSSGDVIGTGWNSQGGAATIAGPVTTGSPFGTYQTVTVSLSDSVNPAQRYQIGKSITSGQTYVSSALLKHSVGTFWAVVDVYDTTSNNKRAWFDLQNGVVGTKDASVLQSGMIDYGDGWWLCWASATVASNSGGLNVELTQGDGILGRTFGDTILIAGSQFEQGATPSSYIPTTSATVTRAAETLTVPAANMPWPKPVEVTGTELVTNGTFASDTSGWVAGTGLISWNSSGYLDVDRNSGTGSGVASTVVTGLTVGKVYTMSLNVVAASHIVRVFFGSSSVLTPTNGATGIFTTTHVATSTSHTIQIDLVNSTTATASIDNISVKEVNPLALSIQMDGRMTYADTGVGLEVQQYRWQLNPTNYISTNIQTITGRTGQPIFSQRQSTSGLDGVAGTINVYNPDVNVPFNIAARHGSTFVNGAHEGTLLIADTTPTILPDLSSTDLLLGNIFMGTIGQFRMWSDDLGDAGIVEASAPSLEPSLSLTFDGSQTSFTVSDWSE